MVGGVLLEAGEERTSSGGDGGEGFGDGLRSRANEERGGASSNPTQGAIHMTAPCIGFDLVLDLA